MALAALTATLTLESWSMSTESFTIFRMFRGVMLESDICWRLTTAFASFASFSCCFFTLVLIVVDGIVRGAINLVGLSAFLRRPVFYTSRPVAATH